MSGKSTHIDPIQITDIRQQDNDKPIVAKVHDSLPPPPFGLLVCGPRKSGKSLLVANLVARPELYGSAFRKEDIIVMSPTYYTDKTLFPIEPKWIFNDYQETVIQDVLDQQDTIAKEYGRRKQPHVLVILDDLMGSKAFARGSIIEKLATQGRHYNVSFIVIAQKSNSLPRAVRENVDAGVFFQPMTDSEMRIVESEFLKPFFTVSDYRVARDAAQQVWSDLHGFVYVHRRFEDPKYRVRSGFNYPLIQVSPVEIKTIDDHSVKFVEDTPAHAERKSESEQDD